MIKVLVFLGLALSIVKANGWLVVPDFCIVFCWGMSIVGGLIYFYAKGVGEEIAKKINNVKNAPAADVVEVVRCKECRFSGQDDPFDPMVCGKHSKKWETAFVNPDDFCSWGERRDTDVNSLKPEAHIMAKRNG